MTVPTVNSLKSLRFELDVFALEMHICEQNDLERNIATSVIRSTYFGKYDFHYTHFRHKKWIINHYRFPRL